MCTIIKTEIKRCGHIIEEAVVHIYFSNFEALQNPLSPVTASNMRENVHGLSWTRNSVRQTTQRIVRVHGLLEIASFNLNRSWDRARVNVALQIFGRDEKHNAVFDGLEQQLRNMIKVSQRNHDRGDFLSADGKN